jgi:L-threonylcarbamoyladenylate synthase
VELFEGSLEDVTNHMLARVIDLRNRNHKVGVIVCEEMLPAMNHVTELVSCYGRWGEWDRLAKRLFATFRVFDSMGIVVILCILPPPEGIGLAVRDRLQRAATIKKPS